MAGMEVGCSRRDSVQFDDLAANLRQAGGPAGGMSSLAEMERLHMIRVLKETVARRCRPPAPWRSTSKP